jgi:hypothetical protein
LKPYKNNLEEGGKMDTKKILPEKENISEFEGIINITKELIDRGIITVRTSLPGKLQFFYEADQIKPVLDLNKIEFNLFKGILESEITSMSSAVLQKRKGIIASLMLNSVKESNKEKEFNEETEKNKIENKFSLVEKIIITNSIKKQVTIKRTSKINVFHDLSWEINEKKYDKEDKIQNLIQAIVKLDIKKPSSEDTEFLFGLLYNTEANVESITFTACKEDLEQISDTINEIKKRLTDLEKEGR